MGNSIETLPTMRSQGPAVHRRGSPNIPEVGSELGIPFDPPADGLDLSPLGAAALQSDSPGTLPPLNSPAAPDGNSGDVGVVSRLWNRFRDWVDGPDPAVPLEQLVSPENLATLSDQDRRKLERDLAGVPAEVLQTLVKAGTRIQVLDEAAAAKAQPPVPADCSQYHWETNVIRMRQRHLGVENVSGFNITHHEVGHGLLGALEHLRDPQVGTLAAANRQAYQADMADGLVPTAYGQKNQFEYLADSFAAQIEGRHDKVSARGGPVLQGFLDEARVVATGSGAPAHTTA